MVRVGFGNGVRNGLKDGVWYAVRQRGVTKYDMHVAIDGFVW